MTCEICRGSQIVRLPRHRPVSTTPFDPDKIEAIAVPYKEYPCPECTPIAPKEKVRVVECFAEADTRYEDFEGYREHVVGSAIHRLAREIESSGFARIQTAKSNRHEFKRTYRVSVGIVAPRVVADLDAERYAAEETFAELVLRIAAAEIDNFGSFYGHADILKRDAKQQLWDALSKAKQTRPRAL